MAFLGLPEKEVLLNQEWIFCLIMGSTMLGFVLVDKVTKQEVYRFAVSFVSSMIGFFLFIKLHTEKEASAVTFTSAVCGFIELIYLTRKEIWRFALGIASAIVGLLLFALSSSFNDLFGKWNAMKIILYTVFSFVVLLLVWFVKQLSFLRLRGARVTFLVWASTTLYSFFSDKAAKGTPDAYSMVSCIAFAMMSFCCGFEELLYFFSAVLTAQLMKTKMLLGVMGISFSYFLIVPDSNVLDESKRLVLPPPKQEVWRLVSVVSAVLALLSTALSSSFINHAIGDSLKILLYCVCIPIVSGILFLKIPSQPYLRIIHLKAHTAIIMTLWTLGSVLYPFLLDDIKHWNAYSLLCWASLALMPHGIPMPTIYRICCFYVFSHAFMVKLMAIKFLFGFVGVGFAFFPVIFYFYLDSNIPPAEHVGIQNHPQRIIVEEVSADSTDEDQPPQVVVIEVEDSPQFSKINHKLPLLG